MSTNLSITEILNNPESFLNKENFHGFFDWFCRENSLKNKGSDLLKKFRRIASSKKFDPSKCSLIFKNNCPMNGSLYDDFRIVDLITGDVIYTVIPSSGHTLEKGLASVWGRENDFNGPLKTGKFKDIVNWFLEK